MIFHHIRWLYNVIYPIHIAIISYYIIFISDILENYMALGFFSSHRSKSPRTVLEVSPLQADYNALSAKQRVAMTHEFLADVEVLRKAPRHVWWSNMVDVFYG